MINSNNNLDIICNIQYYKQDSIFLGEEDIQLVPPTMSDEAVAQAWYRLLRTIGDPVDLCRPAVVSQTQAFLQYAIASPNVIDPCQHPCLQSLPQIFLKAIKGIAGQVDAFLGKSRISRIEYYYRIITKTQSLISSSTIIHKLVNYTQW